MRGIFFEHPKKKKSETNKRIIRRVRNEMLREKKHTMGKKSWVYIWYAVVVGLLIYDFLFLAGWSVGDLVGWLTACDGFLRTRLVH